MTMTPATALGAEPRQADDPATLRHTGTHACWLCGIHQPATSMVADGGPACADIRWYCADTLACTPRWTRPQRRRGSASGPASEGKLRGEPY
jgi:hypothetical protein